MFNSHKKNFTNQLITWQMIKYFYFFALLFSSAVTAQKSKEDSVLILSLAPLALTDVFDGASLRLGGEYKIGRNTAVAIEGGPYLKYLKATKIDPHGFIVRPSVKRYLNGQDCSGRYIALEYQYKNQGYDFRDSIVIGPERFEKQYAMKRVVNSLVFKYGNLKKYGRHFVLEWFCGVGIRHIRSHSNLSKEEADGILTGEAGDCPIQEDIIRLTGTRIFPDFSAGIKIGFGI
jgi:hypothetical protein